MTISPFRTTGFSSTFPSTITAGTLAAGMSEASSFLVSGLRLRLVTELVAVTLRVAAFLFASCLLRPAVACTWLATMPLLGSPAATPTAGNASRLDRVLDLVTEHEGHYRDHVRASARRGRGAEGGGRATHATRTGRKRGLPTCRGRSPTRTRS